MPGPSLPALLLKFFYSAPLFRTYLKLNSFQIKKSLNTTVKPIFWPEQFAAVVAVEFGVKIFTPVSYPTSDVSEKMIPAS